MSGVTAFILNGQPQGEPQEFLDRLAPKTHGERGWQVVLVTAEPHPRVGKARLESMTGSNPIESVWVFGRIAYPAANRN